jgi:PAS domain S-box-containing protein
MLTIPENFLIQIFEKSGACLLVKADPPDFTIMMASDEYLAMTGLKRNDLIGKQAFTVFPDKPDDPSGAITTRKAILEVIATKKKVAVPQYAYAIPHPVTKIMEEFWWASTFEPITSENGEVAYVLGTAADLTEKVRTAQLLKDNQRKQQSLNEKLLTQQKSLERFFMEAPAGICILDGPELTFELINPLYQQLFPGRNLLGKPLLEAVPEVKGAAIWDILQNVYTTGKTFEGNELLIPLARTASGPVEDRYFNFIYQARKEAGGRISGIMVFVIEVTDIVQTKAKVQQIAARLKTQLDAIPQIAWTNTITGEADFYNQSWYDYTGLNFEQAEAWGWKEVIYPDDLEHNLSIYNQILNGNNGGEFEVRVMRKDGAYRWHLIRIRPIKNEAGLIGQWIGTGTDIHELKLLQEQKDDFISIASHELKTPVTSLKASLQIMDRMKHNPSGTAFPKFIEQANRSVKKIGDLIEDLLNAGKANESQLHIIKKTFTVSEMLNSCCNHVRQAGKHELIFQGDKDLQVTADEHRIDQVVVNFVNNAVKYAPGSTNIYLIAEKLENRVKISVRDEGPGIDPDKIPHLFSKYYRAEYTGAQYSGLGLGLYISAEIIRRHGGEIGVDSELGKGSTFWFTLPI